MKNFKILFRIVTLLVLISAWSCSEDVEPIDPYVLNPNITACPAPTSFTSSDFVETKVILNWISDGDLWEVEYGPAGFAHGQGTTVTTSERQLAIDGFDPTAEYDFYIRTNCGTVTSDWVGPISVDDAVVVDPNPNPQTGSFTAQFDNTTFTANQTLVYINGNSIIINAFRTQGDNFAFMLDGVTAGTYAAKDNLVSYTPPAAEFSFVGANPDDSNEDTGSVIITSIDTVNHTISGTFSFKGYWSDTDVTPLPTKQITNGVFTNLPYVTENPNGDTFFAKVNGVEFDENDLLGILTDVTIVTGNPPQSSTIEIISVGAADVNDNAITVSMRSNVVAGTYAIIGDNFATDKVQINYTDGASGDEAYATSGSVTISSITADQVKGTFNTTISVNGIPYLITEGAFDVGY
ncbi:MAG: hypothetical protein CFE23_05170 [Flavobacterium sp. BFFFF1]|uniref:DUF6252 family protein n=1 Tax=Flavobacterium sp. BFFFF1 TaxID=2015557 RepID=UPI000BCD606D|nr:DUF6252 family protein [Flavobacterium sp. BFFFF1]OYU81161.1 MAG: hypothetical protein CFE23_05170 [Flavobacterium sp. BFFFF1]